jgi:hypothetical protein
LIGDVGTTFLIIHNLLLDAMSFIAIMLDDAPTVRHSRLLGASASSTLLVICCPLLPRGHGSVVWNRLLQLHILFFPFLLFFLGVGLSLFPSKGASVGLGAVLDEVMHDGLARYHFTKHVAKVRRGAISMGACA